MAKSSSNFAQEYQQAEKAYMQGRYDEAVSVNGNLVAAASACIALRAM